MLDQGGFQSVWDREIRHFLKLKAMKWPEMKAPSDYISMNTLWPFFKIVGIALMFVFIIGILEVVWPGGKMWTLFKLRLRDTLTVGKIFVTVRLSNLRKFMVTRRKRRKMRDIGGKILTK